MDDILVLRKALSASEIAFIAERGAAAFFTQAARLLEQIPAELPRLEALSLSSNRLTGIDPDLLRRFPDLKRLFLDNNAIEDLGPLADIYVLDDGDKEYREQGEDWQGNLNETDGHQESAWIPQGANWRYLDDGSDQGSAWRTSAFDDRAWRVGEAEFGYGDDDEATVVRRGPAGSRFITTYFRHGFEVDDLGQVDRLILDLLVDDGAVVYLNGEEVARFNLPEGEIDFLTTARSSLGVPEETALQRFPVDRELLREGFNLVAVEAHQFSGRSSDLSFDLKLTAIAPDVAFDDDLRFHPDEGRDGILYTGEQDDGSEIVLDGLLSDGSQDGVLREGIIHDLNAERAAIGSASILFEGSGISESEGIRLSRTGGLGETFTLAAFVNSQNTDPYRLFTSKVGSDALSDQDFVFGFDPAGGPVLDFGGEQVSGAGVRLDQSQLQGSSTRIAVTGGVPLYQSFTAGDRGVLSGLELALSLFSGQAFNLQVRVHEFSSRNINNAPVLAEVVLTPEEIAPRIDTLSPEEVLGTFVDLLDFGIRVEPGDVLAFSLMGLDTDVPGRITHTMAWVQEDLYEGGQAAGNPNEDLSFKTFVGASAGEFETEGYHHIAMTFERGRVRFFYDGELRLRGALSSTSLSLLRSLRFGGDTRGDVRSRFIGNADDILYLPRTLNAHQIQRLAQDGAQAFLGEEVSVTYTFSNLPQGEYDVYLTWPAAESRSKRVFVEIEADERIRTEIVQRFTPGRVGALDRFGDRPWEQLARVQVSDGTVSLTLSNGDAGILAADAVRVERVKPRLAQLTTVSLKGNPLNNLAHAQLLDDLAQRVENVVYTPNGHAPDLITIPTQLGASMVDRSRQFADSDGDILLLPETLLDGQGNLTVEFWLKTADTTDQSVLSVANGNTDNELLLFLVNSTTFRIHSNGGPAMDLTIPPVADNEWHHFSVVRDQARNRFLLYLDGHLAGTFVPPEETPLVTLDVGVNGLLWGQEQDILGGRFDNNQALRAYLDEVRFWGVARDAEMISLDYRQALQGDEENLLAYYRFNDAEGNTALDETENALDGVFGGLGRSAPTREPVGAGVLEVLEVQLELGAGTKVDGDGDPVFFRATSDQPVVKVSIREDLLRVAYPNDFEGTARITVVAHDGSPSAPLGRTDGVGFNFHLGSDAVYGKVFEGDGQNGNLGLDGFQVELTGPRELFYDPTQMEAGSPVVDTLEGVATFSAVSADGTSSPVFVVSSRALGGDLVFGPGQDQESWDGASQQAPTLRVDFAVPVREASLEIEALFSEEGSYELKALDADGEIITTTVEAFLFLGSITVAGDPDRPIAAIELVETGNAEAAYLNLSVLAEITRTTYTDPNGEYAFTDLGKGRTYQVSVQAPPGWEQVSPMNNQGHVHQGIEDATVVSTQFDFGLRKPFDVSKDQVMDQGQEVSLKLKNPGNAELIWEIALERGVVAEGTGRDVEFTAEEAGVYTITVTALDSNGNPNAVDSLVVVARDLAPGVDRMVVSGSSWTPSYLDFLMENGRGEGGVELVTEPSEEAALAWGNLDQIKIVFSEDVSISIEDLTLLGEQQGVYAFSDFQYDPATFRAVWTLEEPLDEDLLTLTLNPAVQDLSGTTLLQDTVNKRTFTTRPADLDNNGLINDLDLFSVWQNQFLEAEEQDPRSDLNGDGQISGPDLQMVRSRFLADQ